MQNSVPTMPAADGVAASDADGTIVVQLAGNIAPFQNGDYLVIEPVATPRQDSLMLAYDGDGFPCVLRWGAEVAGVYCIEGQIVKLVRLFPPAAVRFDDGWIDREVEATCRGRSSLETPPGSAKA